MSEARCQSRRCKIVIIEAKTILCLLGGWKDCDYIRLPHLAGLPEGYTIRNVAFDFPYNAFMVLIEHPSFPEVAPGCMYPVANDLSQIQMVSLREMTPDEKRCADPSLDIPKEQRPRRSWEFLGPPR